MLLVAASSCSQEQGPESPEPEGTAPVVESITLGSGEALENGAAHVSTASGSITVLYDQAVSLADASAITLNELQVSAQGMNVRIGIEYPELEYSTEYTLTIPEGAVLSKEGGLPAAALTVKFTTESDPNAKFEPAIPGNYTETLVTAGALSNAQRLYDYLLSVYGTHTLSGAMAHVDWNTDEADWVYKCTGKYPAVAGFDYLHLNSSPTDWIDYSDISVVEAWYNAGGIVSACWHWNVPRSEGSTEDFTSTASETAFKVSNIFVEGTWEKEVADSDLKEMAGYLKLLQDKNIPVIWRPLHEAAGNRYLYDGGTAWFWWGNDGPDQYKRLWQYMYDFFAAEGVRNLIWVWTTQTTAVNDADIAYYPGDNYVDIVSRDIYRTEGSAELTAQQIAAQFDVVASMVPHKMVTLSECGSVPDMSAQWSAGAKWSWFMPWYDYDNDYSEGFAHEHAGIDWWRASLASEAVITRDELPTNLYE